MPVHRIFLIGYRGSGKTSVGEALAHRLGYEFQDTDVLVEQRLGMTIAEFFKSRGEAAFRERESAVLERLTSPSESRRMVVATGGGIVLGHENVVRMRRSGVVVWLTVSADTIRQRLRRDVRTSEKRPALSGESPLVEVEQVLKERLPLYRTAAHLAISTEDGSPERLVETLLKQLSEPGEPREIASR